MLTAQRYWPTIFFALAALFGFAAIVGKQSIAFLLGGFGIFAAALALRLAFKEARELHERESARLHELEQEVQSERDTLDILTEGLQIGIFACDRKGLIQRANRAAREFFRFPDPEGRTLLAVTLSNELSEMVGAAVAAQSSQRREIPFTAPVDRVALVESLLEPKTDRVYLILYEITDLRRLERVRQDFVANVSHEFRTPMTAIRLMAETLTEEDDVDLRNRYLRRIIDEVDRLSSIAGDLLILSAAENNPVRKHDCDLAEIARSVVHQLERKALEKGLALSFEGPERLMIEANAIQMTQVAMNLVDNAINYTLRGTVDVRVATEGGQAVLEVVDTGIGIASEHVGRIFERFYRVDKGRSRATGGTGLGLSIVRNIVEAHGGQVSVRSALNQGSVFRVQLPPGNLVALPVAGATGPTSER